MYYTWSNNITGTILVVDFPNHEPNHPCKKMKINLEDWKIVAIFALSNKLKIGGFEYEHH